MNYYLLSCVRDRHGVAYYLIWVTRWNLLSKQNPKSSESVTVGVIYRSETVFETLKDPFSKVYNSNSDIWILDNFFFTDKHNFDKKYTASSGVKSYYGFFKITGLSQLIKLPTQWKQLNWVAVGSKPFAVTFQQKSLLFY